VVVVSFFFSLSPGARSLRSNLGLRLTSSHTLPHSAIVGELDVAADAGIDLATVRAPPLRPVTH